MIAPMAPRCDVDSKAMVPKDLLANHDRWKTFHQWKAAVAVKAMQPLGRLMNAPFAACPGILMYHRVVPVGRHTAPTWNVTPEVFERQIRGLVDLGYHPMRLSDLIKSVADDQVIPERSFVVTFDDGYANNALYATPILKALNVPATVFLATGSLATDQPFAFDDWLQKGSDKVKAETWRATTLAECDRMLDSGVIEFGSHTHTHEDFRERPLAFQENLQQSIDWLHKQYGICQPSLSLPYGIVERGFAGPAFFETAKRLGCSCCLTTEEEVIDINRSPFGWGRFIAEQNDTATSLAVKLDGWRDLIRDVWRQVRGQGQSCRDKRVKSAAAP